MTEKKTVSVLFVCMGNICRSPAGEGVFRHYVQVNGMTDAIITDSAGTIAFHSGEPADYRMRQAAMSRGYSLDSVARQVTVADLKTFDLVIAMDQDNLASLEHMSGGSSDKIRMLGSFLGHDIDNSGAKPVPDPYYGGDRGFETVLDMIEEACPLIFTHCTSLLHSNQ